MTITEDASQPTAVHSSTTSATTGSFSPPANSLLVALVAVDGPSSGATTSAVSDSGSHTWTLLKRQNTHVNSAPVVGGAAEVWCTYLSSAPGSITVTSNWATNGAAGGNLVVRVLNGAAQTQNGATGGAGGGSIAPTCSVTTTVAGSRVYGAALDFATNASLTVNGNTTSIDQFLDASNGDTWAAFKGAADTTTPGATTFGYTNANSAFNLAAAEILPLASAVQPGPLVSTPPVPAAAPLVPIVLRGSTDNPPVLTTPGPVVVDQPYVPVLPPPRLLVRASFVDPPTSAPLVVSTVTVPTRTPAVILRASLDNPPVLTTPQPLVVSLPGAQPLPPAALLARASLADAVAPSIATPGPIVVTSTTVPARGGAIVVRASLDNPPVLTSPAPLVALLPPASVLPPQAFVGRSSLVDPPPTRALVVSTVVQPAKVPLALILRGSLVDPAATNPLVASTRWTPTVPVSVLARPPAAAPVVAPAAAAPAPLVSLLALQPWTYRGIVLGGAVVTCSCTVPRPAIGTTSRPGSGTTSYATATTARPTAGTTTRPDAGVTLDPCC